MIDVSEQYKTEMKSLIRPQPLLKIEYGFINEKAQLAGTYDSGNSQNNSYIASNPQELLDKKDTFKSLATLEQDRMLVSSNSNLYIYDGQESQETRDIVLSESMSESDGTFVVKPTVSFTFSTSQDIYGLTIYFDPVCGAYATDFDIVSINISSVEKIVKVTDCTSYECVIDNINLNGIVELKIVVNSWSKPYQRCRINRLDFGVAMVFTNRELSEDSFTHSREVDMLSVELPMNEMTFSINNLDQSFNPINPNGLWQYAQPKQEVRLYYGRLLESGITEWFRGDTLYLDNAPESSDTTATFHAIDRFNCMEMNVYGAPLSDQYTSNGISLWDLAESIFYFYWQKTKETINYVLDECMKEIITKTPYFESMDIKEALQIIANAAHCILYTDEDGVITFKNAVDPIITFSDNGHVEISDLRKAFENNELPDVSYASFAIDYMRNANDDMIIVPDSLDDLLKTGFISDKVSLEDGTFEENPIITIEYSLSTNLYEIPVVFENVANEYAVEFDVNYYMDDTLIETYSVTDNDSSHYSIMNDVDDFNKFEIVIKKWNKPYHRCVINSISFGRVNDFHLDYDNAMSTPVITSFSNIQSISIKYYGALKGTGDTTETDCEYDSVSGNKATYTVEHSKMNNKTFRIKDTDSNIEVTILQDYATYTEFEYVFSDVPPVITLSGNELTQDSMIKTVEYNDAGDVKTFDNPLVSSAKQAETMANWLQDYLAKTNTFSVSYRGNPEVQPFDIIYIETDFEKYVTARTTKNTISFGSGMTGTWEGIKL